MALESQQPTAFAVTILFLSFATIAVALRVTIRALSKQFRWDDALAVCAWMLSVGQAGTAMTWMRITWYGYRQEDVPELSIDDQVFAAKMFWVQGLLYNSVLGLVKWSIIVFLQRLDDKRRGIRWTLWFLYAFNIAHMVSVFLVVIFQCLPVHMKWDHPKTDYIDENGEVANDNVTCIADPAAFSLGTAAIAVATDIAILCVPVAMMWKLRMPIRRKLAVIFVLSLGWVVAIVGIVRITYFVDFWYGRFEDPSWSLWHVLSSIENNVAIVVCCGPALKAFITRFFPKVFGSSAGTRPTGNLYYTPNTHELSSRTAHKSAQDTNGGTLHKGDSTDAIVRSESLAGSADDPSGSEYERSHHAGNGNGSYR